MDDQRNKSDKPRSLTQIGMLRRIVLLILLVLSLVFGRDEKTKVIWKQSLYHVGTACSRSPRRWNLVYGTQFGLD